MGYCKLDCPSGETECCICCEKQDSCQCRCDDMDNYEYAEECEELWRMSHDYILIRTYTWNHSRRDWSCMRSDHVR